MIGAFCENGLPLQILAQRTKLVYYLVSGCKVAGKFNKIYVVGGVSHFLSSISIRFSVFRSYYLPMAVCKKVSLVAYLIRYRARLTFEKESNQAKNSVNIVSSRTSNVIQITLICRKFTLSKNL